MALSISIEHEENSFVVCATIKSDNIINLLDKMQTDAFRIDIADKFFALANAESIKTMLDEIELPSTTEERRAELNESIAELETKIGTPIISIDKSNYSKYYNADDDSLLENGVQLQVLGNRMKMRFAPIQNMPFGEETVSLTILFCVIGFDFDEFEKTNRKAFDVCLLPKLVTGAVEKADPSEEDPVLPNDVVRPDFIFNPEDSNKDKYENNLYVNNGENAASTQLTPLHIVRTSAFTTEEISEIAGLVNDFEWDSLQSTLVNDSENTFINLPFTVNGEEDVENITPVESITAKIIDKDSITSPNNTLTGVKVYEIIQKIETSGSEAYIKDKVKLSLNV